jgi:RND superfamily putative drug exporter
MLASLGGFTYRHRVIVVILYVLALPLLAWAGQPVIRMLKAAGFEDPGRESWQVKARMEEDFGLGQADVVAVYSSPAGTVDDVDVMVAVMSVMEVLEKDPAVAHILSFYSTGAPQLVSADRRRTFMVVYLRGEDQQKMDAFQRLRPRFAAEGLELHLAGVTPTNLALFSIVERDMQRAELIALPLTALLLLLIFGSLASASLPLVVGALAMVLAFALLRLVLHFTAVSIFAANTITVLGLGLAVDYSLFMLTRFREGLPTLGVEGALRKMMATTGRAVLFSGITVAASLMGLWVFPQVFLRATALGGIVIVLGTLLLAMTLLPALLGILGHRIDAWRLPLASRRGPGTGGEGGFWSRATAVAMRRPVPVALLVTAAMLVLAVPFLRFRPAIPDYRVLPETEPVRVAHALLDREFRPNEVTPVDILVTTPGPAWRTENVTLLHDLHDLLTAFPGVERVDSIFSPGAAVPRPEYDAMVARPLGAQYPEVAALMRFFVRGSTVRFSVVSKHMFTSQEAQQQARDLRALTPPPGLDVRVGGPAAMLVDLRQTIAQRGPWMVLAICLIMLVILFLAFGSLAIPFKAMAMNTLSLTASFGAIVWVFQDGRFTGLLSYTPLGFSDATQPIVMFAVVFGLSMDYEVLILTRVQEEYRRTGDNTQAVALGLARTGRLVTNAAALLVAVIGAFATSDIIFMKTMGVGMALAIALDATVVRGMLVPATMVLLGRWNWWAPAPMVRLRHWLGLDHALEVEEPPVDPGAGTPGRDGGPG